MKTWEDELIQDFNAIIKKYANDWYPHLIDDDENDGERFREKIMTSIEEAERRGAEQERARIKEIMSKASGGGNWRRIIEQL